MKQAQGTSDPPPRRVEGPPNGGCRPRSHGGVERHGAASRFAVAETRAAAL